MGASVGDRSLDIERVPGPYEVLLDLPDQWVEFIGLLYRLPGSLAPSAEQNSAVRTE